MPREQDILIIGTRIRIKSDKGEIDGQIINWLTDDNKKIKGYLVKPDKEPSTLITLALDDDFEVIGT